MKYDENATFRFRGGRRRDAKGRFLPFPYSAKPELATSPYGCPEGTEQILGESPEERAWRRFPIDRHKPGGW